MENRTRSNWPVSASYAMVILFGLAAFAVTRGSDGEWRGFFWAFGVLGAICSAIACFLPLSGASLLRLIVQFIASQAACLFGASIDSHLEEMAGMLPALIVMAVALIYAAATLAWLLSHLIRKKSIRRSDRGYNQLS